MPRNATYPCRYQEVKRTLLGNDCHTNRSETRRLPPALRFKALSQSSQALLYQANARLDDARKIFDETDKL